MGMLLRRHHVNPAEGEKPSEVRREEPKAEKPKKATKKK